MARNHGSKERIIRDTEFLAGLLVDDGLLTGEPGHCQTEVGKRALDILYRFESDPPSLRVEDVAVLATSAGTQIGQPDHYIGHLKAAAHLFRSSGLELKRKHPLIDLPDPEDCYARGLIHDLSATLSDYRKSEQQSKELDQYFLAKRLGLETNARHVALHSAYLEMMQLMKDDVPFPKQEAYQEMKTVLKGDGPLSSAAIEQEFQGYLRGTENFSLLLLTVADYLALPGTKWDASRIEEDFRARSGDIVERYYAKAVREGRTPSLLGKALLAAGGMDRMKRYKDIIKLLLNNNTSEALEILGENKLFKPFPT